MSMDEDPREASRRLALVVEQEARRVLTESALEGDPQRLAALRDKRCRKSEQQIAEHLTGNWRDEHLFALQQALARYDFLEQQIQDCEKQILESLAPAADRLRRRTG